VAGRTYLDFELHIRLPLADGTYPVSAHVPVQDQRAEGVLRPPLDEPEVAPALAWIEQGLLNAADVKAFGANLFRALFKESIRQIYVGARQAGPLRLRLIIDAPMVARIPWELLYDPDRQVFLSVEGPVVRGRSLVEPTRPLTVVKLPLRMLVADAFPQGVQILQSQAEVEGIRKALARVVGDGRMAIDTLPHATLAGLQNALREAEAQDRPFHLLHFIGHGRVDTASGRTVLLLEDDRGLVDKVDTEAFVDTLRPFDLKLVFLNACQSAQPITLDTTRELAMGLLASGVPAVIGMQMTVLDAVALEFAHRFYTALADNRPVDVALAEARQVIRAARQGRKADLGIPVCYLRVQTGQILEVQPSEQIPLTRETWRKWLRKQARPWRVVAVAVSLIGAISGSLAIYEFLIPYLTGPKRMGGDINVAVAEFAERDAQGRITRSDLALDFAESVSKSLAVAVNEINAGLPAGRRFIIEVRAPSQTGMLSGASREARGEEAQRLAEEINADVIVTALIERTDVVYSLRPEFHLSIRKLPNAEELVGRYDFGSIENVDLANPAVRPEVRQRLQSNTRALAEFLVGLGYYALDRFDEAADHFLIAQEVQEWKRGREVLYLFLGNTAAKRKDLDRAEANYRRSLQENPEYARARLGMAELVFQHAKGDCENKVNAAGVQAAIREYASALDARDQPELTDIRTKTAFYLGRAYLCLSQASIADNWQEAETQFLAVIDDFERGNGRVRDLAIQAYANLGVVYLPSSPGDPDAGVRYRRAADAYRKAIDLNRGRLHLSSDRKALQAFYYRMLGHIYTRAKDYEQAVASYREAIALEPDPNQRMLYEKLLRQLEDERTQKQN